MSKATERLETKFLRFFFTGPVIRINPHEVHVSDPEFIDDIYTGTSRKTDKYRFTGRRTQSEFLHPSFLNISLPSLLDLLKVEKH